MMQCPICKKDLEIKNKKIGENEAGEAIYNEFAICRDCKKQWNLSDNVYRRTVTKGYKCSKCGYSYTYSNSTESKVVCNH